MKCYAVIFTPHAERQMDRLYRYIADHSGEARADGFVGGIVAECMSLATFPERAQSVSTSGLTSAQWVIGGA